MKALCMHRTFVMHVKWGGMRGPYLRVLCLAVYMCILSFSFPDCSLSDGRLREVSGEGGGQGKKEEIFVGETVSNL